MSNDNQEEKMTEYRLIDKSNGNPVESVNNEDLAINLQQEYLYHGIETEIKVYE